MATGGRRFHCSEEVWIDVFGELRIVCFDACLICCPGESIEIRAPDTVTMGCTRSVERGSGAQVEWEAGLPGWQSTRGTFQQEEVALGAREVGRHRLDSVAVVFGQRSWCNASGGRGCRAESGGHGNSSSGQTATRQPFL